jgi:hypothetical protein
VFVFVEESPWSFVAINVYAVYQGMYTPYT